MEKVRKLIDEPTIGYFAQYDYFDRAESVEGFPMDFAKIVYDC
jgi:hypothetical protein